MDYEFFDVYGAKVAKIGREYLAKIPVKEGEVFVTFAEISRSRQTFSLVLTIQLNHTREGQLTPFSQRIDLNSASATTDLRRSLDSAYGKEHNWTLVLNKAANIIRYVTTSAEKPVNVRGYTYEESPFLLSPFLQKDACNMVFGDSEVGKTYFCLLMSVCLASGTPFLGYGMPETPKKTLFLDYEDNIAIFNNRLYEITTGLGIKKDDIADYVHIYRPQGSIRDLVEVIAKFVTDNSYDLIVIDAGSNAAGGSPNDEQRVVDMFNALEQIPCTKLIIHHEPKQSEGLGDTKAYYGSTFWRALTRVAWRLVLESEEDGKLIKAVIVKKSNLGKVEPIHYRQQWGRRGFDYEEGESPISCTFILDTDTAKPNPDDDAIIELLSSINEMTGPQIREVTGLSNDKFKKAIQRLKTAGKITYSGATKTTRWSLNGANGAKHESNFYANGTNADIY